MPELEGASLEANITFVERLETDQIADYALRVMKGFLMNKFSVLANSWSDLIVIPERMLHLMYEETEGG